MNKLARKTVKYSLILLLLLVVALLAAPFFIDANHYKGLITEKAEQATGRTVAIGGLHASFFPWVGVRLDDVHMANRQGFSNEDFLQVKSLDVRLALLPLLSKRVEIKRFVLDSPKLLLERDASGAGNWEDLLPAAKKKTPTGIADGKQVSAPAGNGASLIALSAKSLRMLNGKVHYRDVRSGSDITLNEFGIEVSGVQLDQPVHVQASGKLSGDAFSVKAEVGPLGDLSKFNAGKLPLQADIQVKSIALEKLATFIPDLTGLGAGVLAVDIRVEQRPDGLRVTAGTLALHGEYEADVAWKIEMPKPDRMKLDRVVVRITGEKAAEMTGSVRGIGHHLQYQVRVNTPTLSRELLSEWIPGLQALYAAHPAPWERVKMGLLAAGDTEHVELRDLQLILNKELVQASGNIQLGARPIVRLRIASKNLHADPWLPQPEKSDAQSQTPVSDNLSIQSQLQNSGWMSGNPTLSLFSGWNKLHGGSMERNSSSDKKAAGRLDARQGGAQALRANGPNQMGQSGEADRRSRVLQLALQIIPDVYAEGARIGQQQTGSQNPATAGARISQTQAANIPINTGTTEEPDLRFLKSWRVTTGLQVDHLFLHGLDLAHLHATLSGKRGIFSMDPFRFELAGGQVSEKASLNVSRYPARWTESVKVRGVQVQPVLKALAGTDIVAGIMQMDTKLGGVGLLPQASLRRLNGTGHVLLRDGMIKGFDIAGTLRNVTALGQQAGSKKTDFSQLSGSFKVRNGVASNDDLFMASPLFRLTGYGQVNLVAKNMDYHVKPRLVGSLAGQGDTEAARKGLVIPLRITGPLDAPRVKVEMDIKTLMGNVGNIKDLIKKGKGGGLKNVLRGVLQGNPASGNSVPGASPAPSQAPAKPVDQILRKLKIPGF